MSPHPYLRAYMAGITPPTALFFMGLTVFYIGYKTQTSIEHLMIFPGFIVPNVFGVWNMLYFRLRHRGYVSIGVHGAFLSFLLVPIGIVVAQDLGAF